MGYAKRTCSAFLADDTLTMGAALAYYTVFSLAPLLLTVISVAGLMMGRETVQNDIQAQVQTLIGVAPAEEVKLMLSKATQSQSGGVLGVSLGIVALIIGATGTFVSLQEALNKIWRVKPDPLKGGVKAFLGKRIVSFGMIMGVAFLMLVSLLLNAALAAAGSWLGQVLPAWLSSPLLQGATFALSFLVVAALFASMFKVLPDVKLAWCDVWVGAVITSALFTAGKTAIGYYLGKSATASAYGAAGSFVVIVVWLYYASLIVLLGAEFTKVWSADRGCKAEPEPGAVRVATLKRLIRT